MIVTLTGENAYGLGRELHGLEQAFVGEHGDLALERIDGQEAEYDRIHEAVTGLPFLASKKMVVLRSPGANKQFVENAEQIIDATADSTYLVIVEPKLDKRLSYHKTLKKMTDFREFGALDPGGLARWLSEESKRRGGSLSVGDAHYLVERIGADQQMLSNELDKLLLFDSSITRATIDEMTEPNPQSTVFQLMEAAFAGDSKRTLKLYKEQRAQRVEPAQIIALLAWQLHILAIVKTAGDKSADQIAKDAKINPYVVRKSQSIARKLTLSDLKRLVSELKKIDLQMKTSTINSDDALQHFLLTI